MYSEKWKTWKALIDEKTCLICRKNNGKIYSVRADPRPKPPVYLHCRCIICKLQALFAGTATDNGVNGADWCLIYLGKLPDYYITKNQARAMGWVANKGNLSTVAPNSMICSDYRNDDGKLPSAAGRVWYEADINYTRGWRNDERILFSNDGLVFVTYDHYETFIEVIPYK